MVLLKTDFSGKAFERGLKFVVFEAVAHLGVALAQAGDVLADVPAAQDAVGHQLGQTVKLLRPEAEAGHLARTHAQRAGGGEALLVGRGLVVDDDVVLLQAAGDFGAGAVADGDQNLVRLGVVVGGIAADLQPRGLQGPGKALGVADNGGLLS